MRIKIITKNIDNDQKTLQSKSFSIVDTDETHLLIESSENKIIGKTESFITSINPSEVLYVESYGNDVYCHTTDGKFRIESRLYEFEQRYRELGFIQINKSYVLNINYVVLIYPLINMRYVVKMFNNEELIVTRTYLKEFKKRIKGGKHGLL